MPRQATLSAPSLPSAPTAPGADLRPFMAAFPTGVAVLTTFDAAGRPQGMTCTSLCSVALHPATLMVCLRTASATLGAVRESGGFSLNLLHDGGRATSTLFGSGAPDRFERTAWSVPAAVRGGPHLHADAHATADCTVVRTVEFGDHTALFAEVHHITEHTAAPAPLLYGLRTYASWSATTGGQNGETPDGHR
ncbi:flavin reductase family protein [Streptomyces olivoreticuli]|uniref:flavin reductase family protein n=1 Tax=Streptomyces olivoreticuli TaxID=68246 RepID=UPI00265837D8|nr:flavin reductase family protein [Streptomyces olivoreticuli]WKK21382.1 flavin reductase family protein [Streptomyces olivoreticuli]